MTTTEKALIVVYFIGVAGSLYFVGRRLLTKWWRWPEGAALLLQHLAWTGLGALTVAGLVWGQGFWGQIFFSFVVLIALGAGTWWLTYLQEAAQRRARIAKRALPVEVPPAPEPDPDPVN